MEPRAEPGSFRDPAGQVFVQDQRILRSVKQSALSDFEFVEATGFLQELAREGKVLAYQDAELNQSYSAFEGVARILEVEKLPFISYPYEWSFSGLKRAALLHLELQQRALERDIALCDATAYNIQFCSSQPVFIDHLSFRRYKEGEFWTAHRQFCEQFLNPLLLMAEVGVPYHAWFRGSMEGIPAADLRRLLPWWKKCSRRVLAHVVLQAMGQNAVQTTNSSTLSEAIKQNGLPKQAFQKILRELQNWIEKLEPKFLDKTVWNNYHQMHGYSDQELKAKKEYVSNFVKQRNPQIVWDLGCNTGDYSFAALEAGAEQVFGFEYDLGALEVAFARAEKSKARFVPFYLDAANPSPNQGWAEQERYGFNGRGPADSLLALAVVHHIAIGRNVPLDRVAAWLTQTAQSGVVEFVPKADPKVKELLALREDIFPDYTEEHFCSCLEEHATIIDKKVVSDTGRVLIWFEK